MKNLKSLTIIVILIVVIGAIVFAVTSLSTRSPNGAFGITFGSILDKYKIIPDSVYSIVTDRRYVDPPNRVSFLEKYSVYFLKNKQIYGITADSYNFSSKDEALNVRNEIFNIMKSKYGIELKQAELNKKKLSYGDKTLEHYMYGKNNLAILVDVFKKIEKKRASSVVPMFNMTLEESRIYAAKAQIDLFENALEMYLLDNGRYPTTNEGLSSLVKNQVGNNSWEVPHLTRIPKDLWGKDYVYSYDGSGVYTLFSLGADGASHTKDDISYMV